MLVIWLEATCAAAEAEGDDSIAPVRLSHLPQLELWAGTGASEGLGL